MALTVGQAFVKFLEGITVSDHFRDTVVPARKRSVFDDLTAAFPASSDLPFWRTELIGSVSKRTAVKPIYDIDLLAVFSDEKDAWKKYKNDSQAFLYRIRRSYDGYRTQQVGARGQAVRVFYKTFGHVDVAPVFSDGGGVYSLPSGAGGWINTAPVAATQWFKKKNADSEFKLSQLVRMLKHWNAAHSSRLSSFHLETMAASTFSSMGPRRRDSLHFFFERANGHLDVRDPGDQSGALSTYLGTSNRLEVLRSFDRAADQAHRAILAERDGNAEEAMRLWRIVLGPYFPT